MLELFIVPNERNRHRIQWKGENTHNILVGARRIARLLIWGGGWATRSARRCSTHGAQGSAGGGPTHLAYEEAWRGPGSVACSNDPTLGEAEQIRQIGTDRGEPPLSRWGGRTRSHRE